VIVGDFYLFGFIFKIVIVAVALSSGFYDENFEIFGLVIFDLL